MHWDNERLEEWVSQLDILQHVPSVIIDSLLYDIHPVELLVESDREHGHAAHSEQEMTVIAIPWQNYSRLKVHNTALLDEVSAHSAKVIE